MVHTFWSVKGGSGVTVTAAVHAAALARRDGETTIVDLCGDQPAAVGLAEPHGAGWTDWLATPDGSPEALARLAVPVSERLLLLPKGTARQWPPSRVPHLVAALAARDRVVVDAGVVDPLETGDRRGQGGGGSLFAALVDAGRSTMVLRPCYMALRRATVVAQHCDDLVVLSEPGRALSPRDVSIVVGARLFATLEVDPAIARSVDAGLLVRRPHRAFERALGSVS